jgi:predicted aminopeptidase
VIGSGCSPLYVLRAGYEEAKILWRREPMERVLARPDLDPAVRGKLETVLAARTFADGIGLAVGDSFGSVSRLDREHNIFVVTAAKQTALEPYTWWFPIVGSVPYKGYFAREQAETEAAHLRERGYDTYVRGAAAFSTLGWFADPLLEHLLRHDRGYLVNLVLHELYHNTFFVPGETAFNESVANFVGHRGAIEFFRARGEDEPLREAERAWRDELRFADFVARVAARLRSLYATTTSTEDALHARDQELAAARAEFETLDLPKQQFASFRAEPLNNAVLLQYMLYTTDLRIFDAIYERTGSLRRSLDLIEAAAREKKSDPFSAVQTAFAGLGPVQAAHRRDDADKPPSDAEGLAHPGAGAAGG